MIADPYIRQGNIFFVPVLRQHLNFAVLVQQALHNLEFDHHDLIAVELPASVEKPIREALQKLPKISLVITSVSDSDQREVFPVTPADAIIEGIRMAIDHNIPLEFIDQELPPGHLMDRVCIADETWPDDALVLKHGAEWYLDLITERLSHPPSRYEPVDSWRELHMAMHLQQLSPFYRRILVVCTVVHVQPVQQLLQQPPLVLEHEASVVSGITRYKIWQPSLPILMSYLDYIPRLVEMYEEHRRQGKAHTFDKRNALMELIYRLQEDARDMHFSIRHYQAFVQMLTRMLEQERQISPHFEAVLLACKSCFNKPFSERVYRHLLGYYDQVKVMRIGKLVETKEPVYEIEQTNIEDMQRVFVARSCTQIDQYYEVIRVPAEDDDQMSKDTPQQAPDQPFRQRVIELDTPPHLKEPWNPNLSGPIMTTWPPRGQFEHAMLRKVSNLAMKQQAKQEKTIEFQGSLYSGIDFRRTLRSYLTDTPKLYVKAARKSMKNSIDRNEPVLWLFQTNVINSGPLRVVSGGGGGETERYLSSWYLEDKRITVFDGTNSKNIPAKIMMSKLLGVVYFTDDQLLLEDIKALHGSSIYERVPFYKDLNFEYNIGYMLSPEGLMYPENASWWEYLLFGAIHYAKETVLVVSPTDFTIPYNALKYAHTKGKDIVQISLSQFVTDEVRRLQMLYIIEDRYTIRRKEANDPHYLAELVENFSDVMKQFW